ncbi:MAG: type II toxin-antitoxin system VapC family toxin [Planctomycetota bacterium]|nr:type II toxin-antitoxin system VapC family toxin [Planctomycetota bacterium]
MKSIYIETTIPSYATARPSADLIKAARQNLTLLFWENERQNYNLYVSDYVFDECVKGDKKAAQRRLNFIADIPMLHPTARTESLAAIYQELLHIPESAKTDAYHLAICVESEIDYLMSWNYSHMSVDAFVKLSAYNNARGVRTPFLITPEYFYKMEE